MRIAVTIGDAAGIGPEVIAKALARPLGADVEAVVYGARHFFSHSPFEVLDVLDADFDFDFDAVIPGEPHPLAARLQLAALEAAVGDAKAGRVDAIVTAPWTKALFETIDIPALGHTEHLARLFEVGDEHVMMLAGDVLRVALVTTHLPLRDVSDAVTPQRILRTLRVTAMELRRSFGVDQPRIAVCGLNPHAGEKGHMGREEIEIIEPALELARREIDAEIVGPFPADTLFTRFARHEARASRPRPSESQFDAVVAMYHDQGLIPLKLRHFGESANITLGLPTPRTSVDHGSAWDIAGKGVADASSMRYALELAVKLTKNRRRA